METAVLRSPQSMVPSRSEGANSARQRFWPWPTRWTIMRDIRAGMTMTQSEREVPYARAS